MDGADSINSAGANEKADKDEVGTAAKNVMVLAATNRP
jgi:hypothetical protein